MYTLVGRKIRRSFDSVSETFQTQTAVSLSFSFVFHFRIEYAKLIHITQRFLCATYKIFKSLLWLIATWVNVLNVPLGGDTVITACCHVDKQMLSSNPLTMTSPCFWEVDFPPSLSFTQKKITTERGKGGRQILGWVLRRKWRWPFLSQKNFGHFRLEIFLHASPENRTLALIPLRSPGFPNSTFSSNKWTALSN